MVARLTNLSGGGTWQNSCLLKFSIHLSLTGVEGSPTAVLSLVWSAVHRMSRLCSSTQFLTTTIADLHPLSTNIPRTRCPMAGSRFGVVLQAPDG